MRDKFEYYRQLLTDVASDSAVATLADTYVFNRASSKDKAEFMLSSIEECNDFFEALILGMGDMNSHSISLSLFYTLSGYDEYKGFCDEDFLYVVTHGSVPLVRRIISNASCPLDFIVDETFYLKHVDSPEYNLLKSNLKVIRGLRIDEIVGVFRRQIEGAEHMSNEMVLKVAGVEV